MMEPFYQDTMITLYCADMREVDLPKAGLVLTDPPFTDEVHQGARTCPEKGEDGTWVKGGNSAAILVDFDSVSNQDLYEMFDLIGGIAQRWVISFMDWSHTNEMHKQPPKGLRFIRHGVWVKPNGAPQFTGDRPSQGWEAITMMCDDEYWQSIAMMHTLGGRMQWNGGGKSSVYIEPKVNGNHRTAKPPKLIERLIKDFSDKGDLIVDPFAGGGVVPYVARLLGRRCVAVEKDEARCETIVQWLKQGTLPRVPRGELLELPLFAEPL